MCKKKKIANDLNNSDNLEDLESLKSLEDSALIERVKSNDELAFKYLVERYENTINFHLSNVTIPVGASNWFSLEDLRQECRLVVYRASMSYDTSKKAKFTTYASVCVRNYLTSFMRKHGNEQAYASLEEIPESEFARAESAEDMFIEDVFADEKWERAFALLTSYERQVFLLYIEHWKYKHIAEVLGKSVRSVDGAISRVKNKLQNYLWNFMD